jgi:hypothetical protein
VSEQTAVLKDVISRLEDSGIRYMLTGSLAVGVYSEPRMTRDVDIVLEIDSAEGHRLFERLAPAYYCDAGALHRAVAQKRLFNVIHQQELVKVDLIVRPNAPYDDMAFGRRRRLTFLGLELWVISPEDLILAKLRWAKSTRSDFQLRDVHLVLATAELDEAYLQDWATRLDVTDLLQELRG